jgi:hypothetical protein
MNKKLLVLLASASVVGVCSGSELFKSLKSFLDHYNSIHAPPATPRPARGIEMCELAGSTEAQYGSPGSQYGSPGSQDGSPRCTRIKIGNDVTAIHIRSSRSSKTNTPFSSPGGAAKEQSSRPLGSDWGSPSPLNSETIKREISLEEGGLFGDTSSAKRGLTPEERERKRESSSNKQRSSLADTDLAPQSAGVPDELNGVAVPPHQEVARSLFEEGFDASSTVALGSAAPKQQERSNSIEIVEGADDESDASVAFGVPEWVGDSESNDWEDESSDEEKVSRVKRFKKIKGLKSLKRRSNRLIGSVNAEENSSAPNAAQGATAQGLRVDDKKVATPTNYRQVAVSLSKLGFGFGSMYLTWKYRNILLNGSSVKINGVDVPIAGLMLGGLVAVNSLIESLEKQENTKIKK